MREKNTSNVFAVKPLPKRSIGNRWGCSHCSSCGGQFEFGEHACGATAIRNRELAEQVRETNDSLVPGAGKAEWTAPYAHEWLALICSMSRKLGLQPKCIATSQRLQSHPTDIAMQMGLCAFRKRPRPSAEPRLQCTAGYAERASRKSATRA
jgi:hypothetical protein